MKIKTLLSASLLATATSGIAQQTAVPPTAGGAVSAGPATAATVDPKAAKAAAVAAEKAQRTAEAAEKKRLAELRRTYRRESRPPIAMPRTSGWCGWSPTPTRRAWPLQ